MHASRKRTTIIDLPVELLLTIFERFNLAHLNGLAKIHPYTQHVASRVFKVKFAAEEYSINKDGLFLRRNQETRMIEIGDKDVMYLALKMFGHLISNLTIDYYLLDEWESGIINGRISKYLGNSLTELTITNYLKRGAHLKYMLGPFKKVETVYFQSCSLGRHQGNLSRIFPALQKLHFTNVDMVFQSAIGHHFPHLCEFKESSSIRYDRIDNLIKLNPQLLTLIVDKMNWNCLKVISDTYQNLEHFELQELLGNEFKDDELHFNHMKTFKLVKMNGFPYEMELPFVFGNDIVDIFDWTTDKNRIEYILRSKSVKTLNIGSLGKKDLQRIAEELPNLEEFTVFYVDSNDAVNTVVSFIETAKQLKKITIMQCDQPFFMAIHKKIQYNWKMIQHEKPKEVTFIQ